MWVPHSDRGVPVLGATNWPIAIPTTTLALRGCPSLRPRPCVSPVLFPSFRQRGSGREVPMKPYQVFGPRERNPAPSPAKSCGSPLNTLPCAPAPKEQRPLNMRCLWDPSRHRGSTCLVLQQKGGCQHLNVSQALRQKYNENKLHIILELNGT